MTASILAGPDGKWAVTRRLTLALVSPVTYKTGCAIWRTSREVSPPSPLNGPTETGSGQIRGKRGSWIVDSWIVELLRARSGQNSYWTAARWAAIGWMNFAMISRCSGLSR